MKILMPLMILFSICCPLLLLTQMAYACKGEATLRYFKTGEERNFKFSLSSEAKIDIPGNFNCVISSLPDEKEEFRGKRVYQWIVSCRYFGDPRPFAAHLVVSSGSLDPDMTTLLLYDLKGNATHKLLAVVSCV